MAKEIVKKIFKKEDIPVNLETRVYNGNNYEWFNKNDNDGKVDGIYIYKNGAYLEEHLNWDCKEDLINLLNGFQDELINKDSNLQ